MGPTLTIPGTNIQIPLGQSQPSLSNLTNNTTTIGQQQNQNQSQQGQQSTQQSGQQAQNIQNQQQTITIPGTNIQIPTSIGGKGRTNSFFSLFWCLFLFFIFYFKF